jgi:hypothetical protein
MWVTVVKVYIRYSKQMPDTSFKTVELGLKGSLTSSDENWHKVSLDLYRELGDQMRQVFSGNGSGKVAQEPPKPNLPAPQREHWCAQHQMRLKKYAKDGSIWYSHRQDNGWCKGS